jgi:hypothetical protein
VAIVGKIKDKIYNIFFYYMSYVLEIIGKSTDLTRVQLKVSVSTDVLSDIVFQRRDLLDRTPTWENFSPFSKPANDQIFVKLEVNSRYQFRFQYTDNTETFTSNETFPITTPIPNPDITDLRLTTKIFENIISWKPKFVDGNLQNIYRYKIEKYELNKMGFFIQDKPFNERYKDLSGTDLCGNVWTEPYRDIVGIEVVPLAVKEVSFSDTNLKLNTLYKYKITSYWDDDIRIVNSIISRKITGEPKNIKHEPSGNKLNVSWTINTDISTNTYLSWDIKWKEKGVTVDTSTNILDASMNIRDFANNRRSFDLFDLKVNTKYEYQIRANYYTNYNTQYSEWSKIYLKSVGNSYGHYTSIQHKPVLNSADDKFYISWDAVTGNPSYDISLSHIENLDISYNINTIITEYFSKYIYPGKYKSRVKSNYGSLSSEWSDEKIFTVPPYPATNFTTIAYNSTGDEDITDVNNIKLKWKNPISIAELPVNYTIPTNYTIPKTYTISRYDTSSDATSDTISWSKDISGTDTSFNDIIINGVQRIFRYELSANY